jgi:hypothetical protein
MFLNDAIGARRSLSVSKTAFSLQRILQHILQRCSAENRLSIVVLQRYSTAVRLCSLFKKNEIPK